MCYQRHMAGGWKWSEKTRGRHAIAASRQWAKSRARQQEWAALYRDTPATSLELAQRFGVNKGAITYALRRCLEPALYRELRRQKRSAHMIGNRRGVGHQKSEAAMRIYRDRWGEKNPNWKGDAASKYTGHSRAVRRFALADGPCTRCGAAAQVRHHRDGNPHNNAPANVELLCRACHMKHHLHPAMVRREASVASRPRKARHG